MHGASLAKLRDARGEGSSEGSIALVGQRLMSMIRKTSRLLMTSAVNLHFDDKTNLAETQFRNRSDTGMTGKFYGRLAPMTRFFVELARTDLAYDLLPLSEENSR